MFSQSRMHSYSAKTKGVEEIPCTWINFMITSPNRKPNAIRGACVYRVRSSSVLSRPPTARTRQVGSNATETTKVLDDLPLGSSSL